jgi:hypothetical protein
MKKHSLRLVLTIILQISAVLVCRAQASKPASNSLQPPPPNIVIDGDAKEWGDSLRYFNADKNISFSLANDKENLYMAMRISDRSQQIRVLRSGITFSIDTKGKKKESFSLTFPLNVQGSTPAMDVHGLSNDVTQADRDDLLKERLTTLRGIKVEGFKDIEGDMITTSNTYGIQTAINYDDKGNLVYEAAIPLKFFHADNITKNEWAFNFKINELQRPAAGEGEDHERSGGRGGRSAGSSFGGGGGGRGGHGGRSGGRGGAGGSAGQGEMFKSVDFWEKFFLAK